MLHSHQQNDSCFNTGSEQSYLDVPLERMWSVWTMSRRKERPPPGQVNTYSHLLSQGCANITCMTMALSLAALSTSTLSAYIGSQITTLERQFGFSSSVSGILLSCNDFGYLLTTLPMAYFARRVHIPRALSVSTLLFGLSGLLCTVPFFATRGDLPSLSEVTSAGNASLGNGGSLARFLCKTPDSSFDQALGGVSMGGNSSETAGWRDNSCEADSRESAISAGGRELAIAFIAVGMILQGFGKSPRQPFMGTYIDDNVPKTKTTLYFGKSKSSSVI